MNETPVLPKKALLAVESVLASLGVDEEVMAAEHADAILAVCLDLAVFLMHKNKAYGGAALNPLRIMSEADPAEQIKVRMDDKLSRLLRGKAAGEDALHDLVGYWVLLQVAQKEKQHA